MGIVRCPKCKMRVLPKQNGTCPSCQTILPSEPTKNRTDSTHSESAHRQLSKKRQLERSKSRKTRKVIQDQIKSFFGLTKPIHNKLSTYLAALSCVILFLIHPDFRLLLSDIFDTAVQSKNIFELAKFLISGSIVLWGFSLSLFYVFSKRERSSFEKYCMGVFVIGINAIASIVSGFEEIESGGSFLVLFPIWNIIIGFVMAIQLRFGYFEITDENVSLVQLAGASLILLVIFIITTSMFQFTWAMMFSICMFYSSLIFFLVRLVLKRFYVRKAG